MRYTFKVNERLKLEQHIHTLFRTGKAYSVFPLRIIYNIVPRQAGSPSPVKAGFSVPKKKFKSSVHRHRIRRLMAEAWRLHKHQLYAVVPAEQELHIFFIFTTAAMPDYVTVEKAVVKGLDMMAGRFDTAGTPE